MIDRHAIEDFLQARRIDAKVFSIIDNKTFSRYSFKLGSVGKVSELESVLREFGLLTQSVSMPVLFADFPSGLVNIDVVTGELSSFSHTDALLATGQQLSRFTIPLILGKDYTGQIYCTDMIDLPHVLVGGSTGSGKSVFLHSTIKTILSATNSDKVKLLLIDPKKVEFASYNKNKHLVGPVTSDLSEVTSVLSSTIDIMNQRFDILSSAGVRSISEYIGRYKMPYVFIIIDEVQDILGKNNKENEDMICIIAQKGRAAGIHLMLATQHPSKEILSPKIKANFPARVGFKTANSTYSRVLLDQSGAEHLLGKGDGIFKVDSTFIRFKAALSEISAIDKKRFWNIFA